eukprot:3395976-Amphidinium_carterae.1
MSTEIQQHTEYAEAQCQLNCQQADSLAYLSAATRELQDIHLQPQAEASQCTTDIKEPDQGVLDDG